jgi:hypothetical protein
LWRHKSDASVGADRQKVFPVSGGEDIRSGFDGTRQNHVVRRIAGDRLDNLRRRWLLCCDLGEERKGCVDLLLLVVELGDEYPFEFRAHELGDEERDSPFDGLFEQPTRRSVGDERRDQDVGVADDAQRQSLLRRI